MEISIEERAKAKPRKRKLYKLGKVSLVKIANLHRQRWRTIKVVKGGKKVVVTRQKVVVTRQKVVICARMPSTYSLD